jgi:histone-lysine N-methyltransferase SETMAR
MIIKSFGKCAHGGCPGNWRIKRVWIEWVCPCNISSSYSIQMKEKLCLTGLLLWTNHGCITTNSNWSVLQCNWKHPSSPSTKKLKFKSTPIAGNLRLSAFWDSQEVLLAHFQNRGEYVNSASYCEVLLKLRDAIRRKRPGQLVRRVLLHHDNARSHMARATQERIQELQWELLEHPPYSPGLAPSNFHLCDSLKYRLGDKRFADDEEV